MRKAIIVMICVMCVVGWSSALAWSNAGQGQPGQMSSTTETTTDQSMKVELGDGQGAVVITGDNNSIYLPPEQPKADELPAQNIFDANSNSLVLGKTDVVVDGVVITYSQIVLHFAPDGTVQVVWSEQ